MKAHKSTSPVWDSKTLEVNKRTNLFLGTIAVDKHLVTRLASLRKYGIFVKDQR